MDQSKVVARIDEICKEFDARVKVVGLAFARLELAKAFAESEAAQQDVHPTPSESAVNPAIWVFEKGKIVPPAISG